MLEGIYNNASKLNALQMWQENISRNIASSQTAGYKRAEFMLESSEIGSSKSQNEFVRGTNMETVPKGGARVDLSYGGIKGTDKPTDFAINGPGYFQMQAPNGSTYFTRNGEFHFNSENTLVNNKGHILVGEGGPIQIDPEQGRIMVASDGTVSQGENIVGRIPVFDFPQGADGVRMITGGFIPKEGVVPQQIDNPSILQGAIESSNVSPLNEMINLILVANAYQASQKYITTSDTLMGQAIQTLGAPPMMA